MSLSNQACYLVPKASFGKLQVIKRAKRTSREAIRVKSGRPEN